MKLAQRTACRKLEIPLCGGPHTMVGVLLTAIALYWTSMVSSVSQYEGDGLAWDHIGLTTPPVVLIIIDVLFILREQGVRGRNMLKYVVIGFIATLVMSWFVRPMSFLGFIRGNFIGPMRLSSWLMVAILAMRIITPRRWGAVTT